MTDDASQYRSTSRGEDPSGWAVGFTVFAAVMMIMVGIWQALANFLFIPYYPFWSILTIAVDIFVIWALAAHGRQFKELKAADAEYRMRR
jgi:uncharacterized membrane protein YedE/YeeE